MISNNDRSISWVSKFAVQVCAVPGSFQYALVIIKPTLAQVPIIRVLIKNHVQVKVAKRSTQIDLKLHRPIATESAIPRQFPEQFGLNFTNIPDALFQPGQRLNLSSNKLHSTTFDNGRINRDLRAQ
jgi:hypothetical protein